MPRQGFDEMQAEVTASSGRLGGCWLPYDQGTYCPQLCQWLVGVFPVRTVLDVGCGAGCHLRLFRSLGCNVVGIEGLHHAATRADATVIVHDLETGPLTLAGIDLAFSVEAAEHIAPSTNFLDTMCCAPVVCFSAAPPGRAGHHHVSCYVEHAWVIMMAQRGYRHFPKLSKIARDYGGGYVGISCMIYVRESDINRIGLDTGGWE